MQKYCFKCEVCGRKTGILKSHYQMIKKEPREERKCLNCDGQLKKVEKENPFEGEDMIQVEMPKPLFKALNDMVKTQTGLELGELHNGERL